jgi:hypothetical protein
MSTLVGFCQTPRTFFLRKHGSSGNSIVGRIERHDLVRVKLNKSAMPIPPGLSIEVEEIEQSIHFVCEFGATNSVFVPLPARER